MHLLIAAFVSVLPLATPSIGYTINHGIVDAILNRKYISDNAIWIDGEFPCHYVSMGTRLKGGEQPWQHDQGWFNFSNGDIYRLVYDEAEHSMSLLNADGSFRSKATVSKWSSNVLCSGAEWFWVRQEAHFRWFGWCSFGERVAHGEAKRSDR